MTTLLPNITLHSARLTLRPPVEADYPAIARFMASPRAAFVGGATADEFQRWRGFLGSLGHWALRGYGMFTLLQGDQVIGRVGLINHIMWDEPELGWQLFDGFEGHGFATEAAQVVIDWAAREKGLGPLISYIDPQNPASRRVAERLGAYHERDTQVLGMDIQVWRHQPGAPA
ncbi:MAG: GNAT family N-acetyltransferase [Pelagimonas sp.]|jgi:RimJ/RimL family protein N-acetyltransferase|nr:GNAT family N-acetyltransferase [Pelagimonas sp.]